MKIFNLNNKEDCAYLAGLFDGEGSVTILMRTDKSYTRFECWCRISNTNRKLLISLYDNLGGNIDCSGRGRRHYGDKVVWDWRLNGTECVPFLMAIRPYLILKCVDVDLCIEMASRFSTHRRGKGFVDFTEIALRKEIYGRFKNYRDGITPPLAGSEKTVSDPSEVNTNSE